MAGEEGSSNIVEALLSELPPPPLDFPAQEEEILRFWDDINAFQTQLELTKDKPEYTFYDGPPFATGLPHYGHILAGTIKDTVTRYASQTGHYVQRRFGWDCHGLPVEFEIDKTLGISSREDVMKMGIATYNGHCRGIVTRYTAEWETTVKRLGRWIDFKNDYKTMNPWFMESVWWVFKQLFEKKLVYQGYKVMPYSTACGTPLSNFEAGLNYKEVPDPAVVVSFPLVNDPAVSLLAWTTTPWTLPSNLGLCVNLEFDYVKIKDVKTGNVYILGKDRLVQLYPQIASKKWKKEKNAELFEELEFMKGKDLVGLKYTPMFDYFVKDFGEKAFRVIEDGYVTNDSGTGIVHQAPAFGEDDYRVCMKHGIVMKGDKIPCPVDFNGCYTADIPDWQGVHVKNADVPIMENIKSRGRLVNKATYLHNYPHCWRSDTPLIYKAVPSWFVAVEQIKDQLLKNNEQTYWVPNFIKEGRFHNWLADARDWAISRNRFWGTPIPIWASEDMEEVVAIGSIAELEELAGLKSGTVTDLHRESIDDIAIKSKSGRVLRRVDEVFDCWFESGSMPYAQQHYPFENKDRFEKGFPAHFIAEGLDQTRGWFYTLMVLSTALFDKPAFTNLIVNGMVLASDGKKMSKRLKNYPDPNVVVSTYGADALRMYLINSPVVRAEPLKFQEGGVRGVVRDLMIPWYSVLRFLIQSAQRWQRSTNKVFLPDESAAAASTNAVDIWILAATNGLIAFVHQEMEKYRLYTVMPRLVTFLEQLTNGFVRLNRERLKGAEGDESAFTGLSVLYTVLMLTTSIMSPFTPYFSEFLYQKLRKLHPNASGNVPDAIGSAASVHFLALPRPVIKDPAAIEKIEKEMSALMMLLELGRKAREARNITLKKPVTNIVVVTSDPVYLSGIQKLSPYVKSELNAFSITATNKEDEWCSYKLVPNFKVLGKRCGKKMKAVSSAIMALTVSEKVQFRQTGQLQVEGFALGPEDISVVRMFAGDTKKYSHVDSDDGSMVVAVDCGENEDTTKNWHAREAVSAVQKLRKAANLTMDNVVEAFYSESAGTVLRDAMVQSPEIAMQLTRKLNMLPLPMVDMPSWATPLGETTMTLEKSTLSVAIISPTVALDSERILADFPAANPEMIGHTLGKIEHSVMKAKYHSAVTTNIDGVLTPLVRGKHYFLSVSEKASMTQGNETAL